MGLRRSIFRWLLGRRLPVVDGTLSLDGASGTIEIARDRWGVPHIEAGCESDAWFALGFCHGQDRGFQLEGWQRLARGTVAAWVGARAVSIDRLTRRIGFHGAAKRRLEAQPPHLRELLESYVRGVNHGRDAGLRGRRCHELVLMRGVWTPYEPSDAVAILSLMSFLLASNWDVELARWRIRELDGDEALRDLDPASCSPGAPLSGDGEPSERAAIDALGEDLAALGRFVAPGGASNNWVLDATRTETGRPLLANDPHLAPTLPSPWYLAHVTTPEFSAAGATFIGGPGFSAGHNEFGAWGMTAGLTDNADLFLEEVDVDGLRVREAEGFVPAGLREERIEVRRGEDVVERVIETRRGPIISPALHGVTRAISMRAVWLDPLPIEGLMCAHHARSLEDFRAYFRAWPALPLNLVWGDAGGRIAWHLVGEVPRRRGGHGTLPTVGRDPDAGWTDERVPLEAMPWREGSPEGFLATANTAPRDPAAACAEDDVFLGVDFLDGFRLERIEEMLRARSDWDVDATLAAQLDVRSLPWRAMRDDVLAACRGAGPGDDAEAGVAAATDLLERWDGEMAVDSPAAAVFEFFLAALCRRVARARAPRGADWALGRSCADILPGTLFGARRVSHLLRLLRERPAGWFEAGDWDEAIVAALRDATPTLSTRHGKDPRGWAWGAIRAVRFRHPLGQVKLLAPIFDRGPYPVGGDTNTVAQAAASVLDPGVDALFVASMRLVIDVGNWSASRWVLPGGQSGNPLSPHYDDQLALWRQGKAFAMPWTREEVDAAAVARLKIEPAAGE